MVSDAALAKAMGKLMAMPFFPSDAVVKLGVADDLLEVVENDEQLAWLVRRTIHLFSKWPGLAEIRAVYCSKFKPRDGVAYYSETYAEGVPSERQERNREIEAAADEKPRDDDAPVSADPKLQQVIASAKLKKFPGSAAAPDRRKR